MANVYDYIDAGFKVFGIHGVDDRGRCACGEPECEAIMKHPVISNWQKVPNWSEDQLDVFEQLGHFKTGFGVLCDGYLIVDVDARNGGVESFKKLCTDIPEAGQAAFVVNTGSGNGSQHHYFKLSPPLALIQNHDNYKGIDFKTSGYVIGSGSLHASGATYEDDRGHPDDIQAAPESLITLLKRPAYHRVKFDGKDLDVDAEHIREIVSYIVNNDEEYETYIRIGMAIHHCLGGEGEYIWQEWCESSGKNSHEVNSKKWHSFGKSANPAGYGTLVHIAKKHGYCEPIDFIYEGEPLEENNPLDTTAVDLKRPPGFVGEITEWINGQCLYPRESLAVAAALCAVSGLAGMRVIDDLDDMTPNLIAFCVAGSGTGKEAVQQAYLKIMRAARIQSAIHGGIKSEQEIMRNLIRHQAVFYVIDELGLVLRKLDNASKRGGASYLEGVVGMIMSIYSKANGFLPITGDLKEEIREKFRNELAKTQKRIEDLPADSSAEVNKQKLQEQFDRILEALAKIDDGLDSPYLTILGFTTPVTFDALMGFEQATNGFMARAMIFNDLETNPKRKARFNKIPMTDALTAKISNLYAPGYFDATERAPLERVGFEGEKTSVTTTGDAETLLGDVYERFHSMAETQKGNTGLEAIPRRGYELAAKVSLILAIPEGVRTAEHVLWGYALALRDVEYKIQLAHATDHIDQTSGMAAKVLSLLEKDHGESIGVIKNRLKLSTDEETLGLLEKMVEANLIKKEEFIHGGNKTKFYKYFAVK